MGISAEVISLTPAIAKDWIKKNLEHQRQVQERTVNLYAAQMKNGEWLETGESIIFDDKGKLLNGQHRLSGVIRSGHTIENQVVVYGVKRDAFRAMDTGRKRMASDVLTIAGEGNGQLRFVKALAAAASYGYLYSLDYSPLQGGARVVLGKLSKNSVTHADILKFVQDNPTIKQSAEMVVGKQGFTKLVCPPSTLIWVHFQARKKSIELADQYAAAIITGEKLTAADPFYVMRELLIELAQGGSRTRKIQVLAAFVKAWNAKRDGEKITRAANLLKKDWDKFPKFK